MMKLGVILIVAGLLVGPLLTMRGMAVAMNRAAETGHVDEAVTAAGVSTAMTATTLGLVGVFIGVVLVVLSCLTKPQNSRTAVQ